MDVKDAAAAYRLKAIPALEVDGVPPGYKRTEVGVIPAEWMVQSLDSIASVTSGKRLPLGSSLTDHETPYPYIRVVDMCHGSVLLDDIKFVPANIFPAIKRYRIFTSDIFISVAGTLGLVGKVPGALDGANLTENADRITDIKCSQGYLLNVLTSPLIQDTIDALRTVGAQPKLALERIRKFAIPLPPTKAEQRAIAEALSDTDALIASLQRLIAKKRAIKQGTMQALLTGRQRLPGFTGEWETRPMSELFTFSGGMNASREQLSSKGHCYLHYGDIHTSTKTIVDVGTSFADIPKLDVPLNKVSRGSLLNTGDVVFVDASEDEDGASKHMVVENPDGCPFISGLHTIVAKPKNDALVPSYCRYCFQTRSVKSQFRFFAVGTKVLGVSKGNIGKIEVLVPSREEQTAIATVLADMDAEIEALESRLTKTRELKTGVMQQLLTGRIRLPLAEAA